MVFNRFCVVKYFSLFKIYAILLCKKIQLYQEEAMLNIIICDDEKSYQEILEYKINKIIRELIETEYNIICINSLSELERELEANPESVVFLDVMIDNKNSLEWMISKSINALYNSNFIIMTSFPIESYKLSEVDFCYYLIKQKMDNEQLQKALIKAINKITKHSANRRIIKIGSKNYTVSIQDITYIETFNNNISIHLIDDSCLTIYSTLKEFSKQLTPNFLRCHKCYMVNMNHIKRYEPHKLCLFNGDAVPVPPKKYGAVVEAYKNYLRSL